MNPSSCQRHLSVLCTVLVATVLMTEPAFAAGGLGNIENVLQNIVDVMTGNVARLLGVIAIVLVGLAWMFNMVDLRAAGMVVLGIAIIFGATEIVALLTGS